MNNGIRLPVFCLSRQITFWMNPHLYKPKIVKKSLLVWQTAKMMVFRLLGPARAYLGNSALRAEGTVRLAWATLRCAEIHVKAIIFHGKTEQTPPDILPYSPRPIEALRCQRLGMDCCRRDDSLAITCPLRIKLLSHTDTRSSSGGNDRMSTCMRQ